jgi:methionine synthase II (cobalamin-independent)
MPPPSRVSHIGSLLRPPALIEAQKAAKEAASLSAHDHYTSLTDPKYAAAQENAIKWVIEEQISQGITPITSGEYERLVFYSGLFEKIPGIEQRSLRLDDVENGFRSGYPTVKVLAAQGVEERPVLVCTSPIALPDEPSYASEFLAWRNLVPQERWRDVKVTIPSVTYQHIQIKQGVAYSNGIYKNDNEYFEALGKVWRREIAALVEAGVVVIQVDDPNLTFFCDDGFLDGLKQDGVDADDLLDTYIRAHNACLAERPKGMRDVGIHLCRGNFTGNTSFASGTYDRIAEKLFNNLNYDTFYLEYDDARSGDFGALKYLPKGKNVVLGLVSTKHAELEDVQRLKKRVLEAVDVVAQAQGVSKNQALDSLAISPQCGFSSAAAGGGKGVTMEIMWQKLGICRQVANEIWGEQSEFH